MTTAPWQERSELLLGKEALEKLADTSVAVIGLGGVGGYAAEALVRAGIGRIILCDADVISESNINRQLLAKSTNIGKAKVALAAQRAKQINPHAVVLGRELFFHEDTAEEIFALGPEVVLDAIDSLNPKLALITNALTRHIPLVTAMGAALRYDPTQIAIAPLDEVTNDRLGAKIRKGLRHRGLGAHLAEVLAVYSKELPDLSGMGEPDESEAATTRGRVRRPLGTISPVPAVLGFTVASAVLAIILADYNPAFRKMLPAAYRKKLKTIPQNST